MTSESDSSNILLPRTLDSSEAASPWVQRFVKATKPHDNEGGYRALDLACGSGRHSKLLLAMGYEVSAVDIDTSKVESLGHRGLHPVQIDLENGCPDEHSRRVFHQSYDCIVVTRYLHRPLFSTLFDALAPGGLLIYETFGIGNEVYGRPRSPSFLLAPGELLQEVGRAGERMGVRQSDGDGDGGFETVAYEHGFVALPKPAVIQRIAVRRLKKHTAEAGSFPL